MPFAAILIGAVLLVAAIRGTHGQLGQQLQQDIPGFFKWALAIGVILALGYIPALKTPSRWLLGLVALVILLTQYQNIYDGITAFAQGSGQPSGGVTPSPAAAQSQNIAATPTQAEIYGDAQAAQSAAPGTGTGIFPWLPPQAVRIAGAASSVASSFGINPQAILSQFGVG